MSQTKTCVPLQIKEHFTVIEIATIAMVCHEANRAYCESIGDNSQLNWNDAPDWQRKSAILGVEFHLTNPFASPSDSHISWLKEKKADGWKYGEVKNVDKKEHPCYVPYNQLPIEQRMKDYIFSSIVKSFIKMKEDLGVYKLGENIKVNSEALEAVGFSFNPSGNSQVDQAKLYSAKLIDLVIEKNSGIVNTTYWTNIFKTQAINLIIQAQMAVVKFITWK